MDDRLQTDGPGGSLNAPTRGELVRVLLVLGLVCGVALGASLAGDFVWDDRPLIADNHRVKSLTEVPGFFSASFWETGDRDDRFRAFFRPVIMSSYAIDYAIWGARPFGFHLTNLIAHLGCCLLVWRIARREGLPSRWALLGGCVFAAHPVHVESVAWISGRTDVLCSLAVLAAWWLQQRAFDRGRTTSPGALALFLVALLAKEMAVTLPVLLLADRLLRRRLSWQAAVRSVWPYAFVFAAYLGLRHVVLGPAGAPAYSLEPVAYLASGTFVLARYVVLLLLPVGLDAHYPHGPVESLLSARALLAVGILAVVTFGLLMLRRRSPRSTFWGLWILLGLAPVLLLGRFGDVLMADRFLYLPSVGFAMLVALAAAGCERLQRGAILRVGGRVVAIGFVAALSLAAGQRTRVWSDDLTLFRDMVRTSPDSALVRSNLGLTLYHRGHLFEAIAELEIAVQHNSSYALAHNNLAAALERTGKIPRAMRHYERALELAPGLLEAGANSGSLLVRRGRTGEGIHRLREILRLHPRSPAALYALADALDRVGRSTESLSLLDRLQRFDETHPEAHYLRGKIRFEQGRTDEAAESMRHFLRLWDRESEHAAAARRVIASAESS